MASSTGQFPYLNPKEYIKSFYWRLGFLKGSLLFSVRASMNIGWKNLEADHLEGTCTPIQEDVGAWIFK